MGLDGAVAHLVDDDVKATLRLRKESAGDAVNLSRNDACSLVSNTFDCCCRCASVLDIECRTSTSVGIGDCVINLVGIIRSERLSVFFVRLELSLTSDLQVNVLNTEVADEH